MIQMSRIDQHNAFYVNRRFLVSPLASVDPDGRFSCFLYWLSAHFVFGWFFVAVIVAREKRERTHETNK